MGYEKLNSNVMTVGCQGGGKKKEREGSWEASSF